jgi:hypothetical protein
MTAVAAENSFHATYALQALWQQLKLAFKEHLDMHQELLSTSGYYAKV